MSNKEKQPTLEWYKVLRTERLNENNRLDLRVAKWAKAKRPVLEKRRIWERDGGETQFKLVGLNAEDVRFVYENYPEIINLL